MYFAVSRVEHIIMSDKCCLLVCGGGNGAHVISGLAAADANTEVRVLTMFGDEAARWTKTMETNDFIVRVKLHAKVLRELKCKPDIVSKEPAVAKGCNLIILVVPAFGHAAYLQAIKPYVAPGTTIIGLPGQAGFEFDVRGILGDVAKDCTLVNFESLPWACRIAEYGKEVEILGTKAQLSGALERGQVPSSLSDPVATLQRILGENPVLRVSGHILGMTLMAVNAYVHPAILYGRFHNYNGEELAEAPLFYQGMDQFAADTMTGLSDEVLAVAKAISTKYPDVDLSNVIHIFPWFLNVYGEEMKDHSSLLNAITSNDPYIGLKHAMVKTENGGFKPDFGYRYFTEDVPYGLAVLAGTSEVVGISTQLYTRS